MTETTEYDAGYPDTGTGAPAHAEVPGGSKRERSSIAFPYGDLVGAIELAQAVSQFGLDCDAGQLAGALDLASSGGMFRQRVSSAQHFGLIDSGGGRHALTNLGRRILDPAQEASAKVEAFLSVPLYAHIYKLFDGTPLPNDQGLEAEMVKAGVAKKQVPRARQAFARSADQAGFFSLGRSRLVRPGVATIASEAKEPSPATRSKREAGVLSDSLLAGLFERMLPPEGEEFSARERRRFFRALAINLDVIYGEPSDGGLDPDNVANLYRINPAGVANLSAESSLNAG